MHLYFLAFRGNTQTVRYESNTWMDFSRDLKERLLSVLIFSTDIVQ